MGYATEKGAETRRKIVNAYRYFESIDVAPRYIDVARRVGLSKEMTHFHVRRLLSEGKLVQVVGSTRNIRVKSED